MASVEINDWRAEYDAGTLMEAEIIKKDKVRLEKATKAALKIVERKAEELKSAKKVSKIKTGGNNGFNTR